jgi:hypothetical protein
MNDTPLKALSGSQLLNAKTINGKRHSGYCKISK